MKKSLLLISFFFFLFLFLNIKKINTIDSMVLMYEKDDLFEQDIFDINFYAFNVKEIPKAFRDLDIEIIRVVPKKDLYDNEALSVIGNNYEEITFNLMKKYSKRLAAKGHEDQSLYYLQQGFSIQSMKIRCLIKDLTVLESRINII